MAKLPSPKRLFEIRLERGRNHPKWRRFHDAVTELNGKGPGYDGITNVAIIGTHHDQAVLTSIISGKMRSDAGFNVTEITKTSIEEGAHAMHQGLIDNYFLPYDSYPALED